MYSRTLKQPLGTSFGGALSLVDIAGILCWDPSAKILRISICYGVNDKKTFLKSTRSEDNLTHQFNKESYDYIVGDGIKDELGLWTRMYERLGIERPEAKSF